YISFFTCRPPRSTLFPYTTLFRSRRSCSRVLLGRLRRGRLRAAGRSGSLIHVRRVSAPTTAGKPCRMILMVPKCICGLSNGTVPGGCPRPRPVAYAGSCEPATPPRPPAAADQRQSHHPRGDRRVGDRSRGTADRPARTRRPVVDLDVRVRDRRRPGRAVGRPPPRPPRRASPGADIRRIDHGRLAAVRPYVTAARRTA